MSKRSKLTRHFRDTTYHDLTLTDGTPFLRPVTTQGKKNCLLHHLSRMVDHRYRKNCTDNNILPKYQVLCPDEVGGFKGNPYINKEGVEMAFDGVIMKTAVERGLPVTGDPNLRYHIKSYKIVDNPHSDSSFKKLKKELDSFGPFIVGFEPKSDFPPKFGKVYKGLGEVDLDDDCSHSGTVIGYGEVVVTEKIKRRNKPVETKVWVESRHWIVENSWRDNELPHRIDLDQIEDAIFSYFTE